MPKFKRSLISFSIIFLVLITGSQSHNHFESPDGVSSSKVKCQHSKMAELHTKKLINLNKKVIQKSTKKIINPSNYQSQTTPNPTQGFPFKVEFDYSHTKTFQNKEILSFMHNIVFTKISRLLSVVFKLKFETSYSFDPVRD